MSNDSVALVNPKQLKDIIRSVLREETGETNPKNSKEGKPHEIIPYWDGKRWVDLPIPKSTRENVDPRSLELIDAEDEQDCRAKGGEWINKKCVLAKKSAETYPESVILRFLAYVKSRLDKEWRKEDQEAVQKILTGRKPTGEVFNESAFLKKAREDYEWSGREHQKRHGPTYIIPSTYESLEDQRERALVTKGLQDWNNTE